MKHGVKAPNVGESITEVSILKWAKNDGEAVNVGDVLLEIESDKATVEVVAETKGALKILKAAGERVPIGATIGEIDDSATGTASAGATAKPAAAPRTPPPSPPPSASSPSRAPAPSAAAASVAPTTSGSARISKNDFLSYVASGGAGATAHATPAARPATASVPASAPTTGTGATKMQDRPGDRRVPMTRIRAKIAERLVQAQHTAAILTTFNEVDMSAVMKVRSEFKEKFQAKHGVPLTFMSFFTRASVEALKQFPAVNAYIDGQDTIFHDYYDIGIAVGTERGLVVPVIRNAESMGFVEIEKAMGDLAARARNGKLSIADMAGGTFTISNGGTYGSLLSTPILNPPQSGILGMHKIEERPVAIAGKVEIRPMMYLALSYDHRIIDGKEAVSFLVALKGFLEKPETLGLEQLNGLK
ncbi:MAG: 2-oxoglutarate dehydrogenase complex dihydrolipoyllysine-residue succinyltransferase [Bacteriovoracia bacterium]